jgi:hypothetical protein
MSPYSDRLEGRGSIPGKVKGFSLLNFFQTGSGAHTIGTGGYFPRSKTDGDEADSISPFSAKGNYIGAYLHFHSSLAFNCSGRLLGSNVE